MSKFTTKDVINVGIFTAIYMVTQTAVGMTGYFPPALLLLPLTIGIGTGIPFILFLTKVDKFGMITLMGVIAGGFMFLTGHTLFSLMSYTICALLADLVLKSKNYASQVFSVVSYSVFSLSIPMVFLPFFINREAYLASLVQDMGQEYVDQFLVYIPDYAMVYAIAMSIVGSIIGGIIGIRVLRKHFEKAGIA